MKKTVKLTGSLIVAVALLGCGESGDSSNTSINNDDNTDVTIQPTERTINTQKQLRDEATKQGLSSSLNTITYAIENEPTQDAPVVEIAFEETTVYGVTGEKSEQLKNDALRDAKESVAFIDSKEENLSQLYNSVLCTIPKNTIAKELNATLRSCVEQGVVDNVTFGKAIQLMKEGNSTSYTIPYVGEIDNIKISVGDVNKSEAVAFDVNGSSISLVNVSSENPDNTRMELMINGLPVATVADENKTLTEQREAQEVTLVTLSENIDAKFESLDNNMKVIDDGLKLFKKIIDENNGYDESKMKTAKENLVRGIGFSEDTYSEIQVLYAQLQKGIDERFQKASVLEDPNGYANEVRNALTLASQKINSQKHELSRLTTPVSDTQLPTPTPTPPPTGGGSGGEF